MRSVSFFLILNFFIVSTFSNVARGADIPTPPPPEPPVIAAGDAPQPQSRGARIWGACKQALTHVSKNQIRGAIVAGVVLVAGVPFYLYTAQPTMEVVHGNNLDLAPARKPLSFQVGLVTEMAEHAEVFANSPLKLSDEVQVFVSGFSTEVKEGRQVRGPRTRWDRWVGRERVLHSEPSQTVTEPTFLVVRVGKTKAGTDAIVAAEARIGAKDSVQFTPLVWKAANFLTQKEKSMTFDEATAVGIYKKYLLAHAHSLGLDNLNLKFTALQYANEAGRFASYLVVVNGISKSTPDEFAPPFVDIAIVSFSEDGHPVLQTGKFVPSAPGTPQAK